MYRSISFTLILLLIWQVIGVGFSVSFNPLSNGDITLKIINEKKVRLLTPIPAIFSGVANKSDYESMTFVGDVLLARNVEFLMRTKGNDYPFAGVDLKNFGVKSAVVGNFEASVPQNHKPTPIGKINFSVPTTSLSALDEAGFSHFSLANNHSYDFGKNDFLHTVEEFNKEFKPFGHPNDILSGEMEVVTVSDQRISLLGLNAVGTLDKDDLKSFLRNASKLSDYQVVYIHWGEEYALRHNEKQTKLAELLVSYGADLIIGHHPHVVQGIDLIEGVPVFYSLGNYIFDQYFSKDVQEGLVLSVYFDEVIKVNLIPVSSKSKISQPNFMETDDHAKFLTTLAKKSHPELRKNIEQGFITTDLEIATSDKVAIILDVNKYVQ